MASYMNPKGTMAHGRQLMQETHAEKMWREKGKFPQVEAELPVLRSRKRASIVDKLSALLGTHNPLAKPVSARDHDVWLFDGTARRTTTEKDKDSWTIEVVAAYFVKDSGDGTSEVVAKISQLLGLAHDSKERDIVAKRLEPFMDIALPAHTTTLELNNQTFKLGPSNTDGITSDEIRFTSTAKPGDVLHPQLVGIASVTPMTAFFADPEGWAVVSDVDDTIKKTMTGDALGVLRSTFVEDPVPIAGMPELYQHIARAFNAPPFWYLSASPYNLYAFLSQFKTRYAFPPGQLILRDASWMSLAGLLTSVTQGTQAYKLDRLQKIHGWFPKRKVLCIGDSTQSDPEAYADMYRAQPEWIKAIFIRRVRGVNEPGVVNEDDKIKDERFDKAFKDVPREIWHVFDEPKEVYEVLERLNAKSWKLW